MALTAKADMIEIDSLSHCSSGNLEKREEEENNHECVFGVVRQWVHVQVPPPSKDFNLISQFLGSLFFFSLSLSPDALSLLLH